MKKDLRIVFFGTPDFAVESLKAVVESGRNVVAVVTAVDKKSGRGQKIQESAVKQYAISKGLLVLQPNNLKSMEFYDELKALQADIQIVVAFRMLPESVWNMPPLGTFNLHASLLPKYRGAAPINWAIINGEKQTGLTTFFLKHQIDTGNVVYQEQLSISEEETAGSLHDRLMNAGGPLVIKTLEALENDRIKLIPQEELINDIEHLPKAPKIFKADCKINWSKPVKEINQLIRGLSPYPASWTQISNPMSEKTLGLKIYEAKTTAIVRSDEAIGNIRIENQKIFVAALDNYLEVEVLQLEGKKRMMAKDLLNGFNLEEYSIHMS